MPKHRPSARRNAGPIVLDLVESMKDVYRPWETIEDENEELHLGRLSQVSAYDERHVKASPSQFLYISPLLIYSDYSGSDVEQSNVRVFLKEHGGIPGVHEVHGGYGTKGIAIRLDVSDEGVIEALRALEEYPVLDEDDLGSIGVELADKAAESYGYSEFIRAIESACGVEIADDDESMEGIQRLFWESTQDLPEPYRLETGGSVYFFIDLMVESLGDADQACEALDDFGIKYEDA